MPHPHLLWLAAQELAGTDTIAAIATVSRRRGSLPMARDAKMVVAEDGRRWGTVGGGCIEADVTQQALAAARTGRPLQVEHTLNADLAGDVGLSCGGTVQLFLEPVIKTAEAAGLYGAVATAVRNRVRLVICTGLDWSAGPIKMAVIGDEEISVGRIPASHPPHPAPRAREDCYIDEGAEFLVELVPRVPRLIVIGAGHVGVEIAKVAAGVGFHVVVMDDRAEFANHERIPFADEIVVEDFRAFLDRMKLDEDDYVLATTRGHAFDAYVIERTAGSLARYVGMLGSRRKKEVVFKALEDTGVPREVLDRVRVPIGEPIGADTPEEIAVSVVAELIRVRRDVEAS